MSNNASLTTAIVLAVLCLALGVWREVRPAFEAAPNAALAARDVNVADGALNVQLTDGRLLRVPLQHLPRLARATPDQRADWKLEHDGRVIRWRSLDKVLMPGRLVAHLVPSTPPSPASPVDSGGAPSSF